ncbi:MAG: MFS transporter [Pirellulales bacterium]
MSQRSRTDPIRSLREPGFLIYLIGTLLSNTGNQMRTLVVGWEVYERTGEAWTLGIVGLVLAIPVLVLALPAGMAADRFERKHIIMFAQAGLAASGLGLAWVSQHEASLVWLYLWLLGTGSFRAIGWPASQAIVTGLVPSRVFPNAAMWRSMAFQTSMIVGPLIGAFVLAHTKSAAIVYLIDACTSVILILCLAAVRPKPQARHAEPRSWRSFADGVRFVRRQPLILSTITLDMVAVLFGGVTALLPIYAKDILMVGEPGLGWLKAMQSLGAITMSLLLALRPPISRGGPALLWAVSVFGVATIIFGLSESYVLSLAALFVAGAADSISVVIRSTLVQLLAPDSMRGRVAAVNTIFIGTSNEIGEFESGMAAELLGPVLAVAGGGVMTLVTVFAVAGIWPQIAKLGSLEDLQPAEPVEVT